MGSNTWLISGSPGCGKTNWILNNLKSHKGRCGFLRLSGYGDIDLQQVASTDIDYAFLKDQIPQLIDLSRSSTDSISHQDDSLILIELPQFRIPKELGLAGIDPRIIKQLATLNLEPDKYLHFGRDRELPINDTLNFNQIESCRFKLHRNVWDPPSLNTFWFELVNGAYGDVYRAKALMNIPDGRSMFFNWIVSQKGSQFLPLNTVSPPSGRPTRISELVVQGKNLDSVRIESTIQLCLLNDSVLELHQAPLRDTQMQPSYST
tara:strand:- start:1660 stop:2448 length:789 start_codon:yes stop_codon:yes gene_type:complete